MTLAWCYTSVHKWTISMRVLYLWKTNDNIFLNIQRKKWNKNLNTPFSYIFSPIIHTPGSDKSALGNSSAVLFRRDDPNIARK